MDEQQFEPWSASLQLDAQELPGKRLRVSCALPDLLGLGPIEIGPVELNDEETAKFVDLFEQAMALLRIASQRVHVPKDQVGELERPTPSRTDPHALSPRRR